jgi:hypothetical protein
MYVHISTIAFMQPRVCTLKCNQAHTCTRAQACLCKHGVLKHLLYSDWLLPFKQSAKLHAFSSDSICMDLMVPTLTDTLSLADLIEGMKAVTLVFKETIEEQRKRDEKLAEEQRKRDEKLAEEQRKCAEEQRKRDEKLAEEQRKLAEEQSKILTFLQETKTESQTMSAVTSTFATSLLDDLGIKAVHAPSKNTKEKNEFVFDWGKGEDPQTSEAILHLEQLVVKELTVTLMEKQFEVHIQDVHHNSLLPIIGCQKKLTGKTDALIRIKELAIDTQAVFSWALGAVEFKTNKQDLNFFQQVFELIALSHMSQFEKGVVLLGTDLNAKWQVLYFEEPNRILCCSYKCGTHAISQLKDLLISTSARVERLNAFSQSTGQKLPFTPSLASLNERDEQDLNGYDNIPKTQADVIQSVQNLARVFNKHGISVEFPGWLCKTRPAPPYGMYV